jgi:HEAT repeat protein
MDIDRRPEVAVRPRYADLFQALKDPDPARADAAFDALLFDRADAIADLAEAYGLFRKEPVLRFCVIQLLGFTEDPRAIPHVMEALRDPDPSVRAEACRALEDLRARDATQALLERSQDLDPNVREAARDALAALSGDGGGMSGASADEP